MLYKTNNSIADRSNSYSCAVDWISSYRCLNYYGISQVSNHGPKLGLKNKRAHIISKFDTLVIFSLHN
jgi:hypothetical protein